MDFNSNNFNLAIYFSTVKLLVSQLYKKSNLDLFYGRGLMMAPQS